MYLYKLVDEKGIKMAKKGIVSLSHPIFQFKGSEGKIINFAKRIYDKYLEKGLNLKPSEKDLEEIKGWINVYKDTYGKDFQDIDIISETMIIFCGIMQGFCGYFTTKNLFDKRILAKYHKKLNTNDKVGVIRIDFSSFQKHHWRTEDLNEPFIPFKGDSDDMHGYYGFIHPTKIVYSRRYDSYKELLRLYNSDRLRHASSWFNILSKKYKWQNELRIIFLLRSLEKNSSRLGCDRKYNLGRNRYTWEEIVFCNIVDAIHYCKNGPDHIYLNIGKENINISLIDDIL